MASIGPFEPDSIIRACEDCIKFIRGMHQKEDLENDTTTVSVVFACIRGGSISPVKEIKRLAEKAKKLKSKVFLSETELEKIESYIKSEE